MCTSSSTTSLALLANRLPLPLSHHHHRRRKFLLTHSLSPFPSFLTRPPTLAFSAGAAASSDNNDVYVDVDVDWLTLHDNNSDDSSTDDFRGWNLVPQTPTPRTKKNTGLRTFLVAGVGTSVAILIAAVAHFTLAKNGFRLPFRSSQQALSTLETTQVMETEAADADYDYGYDVPCEENEGSESVEVELSDVATQSSTVSGAFSSAAYKLGIDIRYIT